MISYPRVLSFRHRIASRGTQNLCPPRVLWGDGFGGTDWAEGAQATTIKPGMLDSSVSHPVLFNLVLGKDGRSPKKDLQRGADVPLLRMSATFFVLPSLPAPKDEPVPVLVLKEDWGGGGV